MYFSKQPQGHEKNEKANYLLFSSIGESMVVGTGDQEQPQDSTLGCGEAAPLAL